MLSIISKLKSGIMIVLLRYYGESILFIKKKNFVKAFKLVT
jgi:hypothetical protein